jgi:4-carboxymuconolactone decarboxylase
VGAGATKRAAKGAVRRPRGDGLEAPGKGCHNVGRLDLTIAAAMETMVDKALRDKGLAIRKAVLGEEYVNRAAAAADDFNGPFQDILNEYCWGLVWSDERLPKKTRSMLNLVMLACLNRMHEWELHLRGALRNGVSKEEIQAIIHQIAIYAGVPLGVECFRTARKVFAEMDKA